MKILRFIVSLMLAVLCSYPVFAENKTLMMATTTSTDDTGLLDYLSPACEKSTGIHLKWTATGTGKALKLGENCDVDILMVHAPGAEKTFVESGYGLNRKEFMFNDFVIIGPESDPAGLRDKSVKEAFQIIRDRRAVFVSRGDNSGTHKKELSIWKLFKEPAPEKEPWYIQTGQGMLATINIASEKKGYTITDRGTYITYEAGMDGKPPMKILVEGDSTLVNQYSVITVNPARCPKVHTDLADIFSRWITSKEGQDLIRDFKLMGKQLFTPNAK